MLASLITREIELFENQRYVFTQFSSKSLLPTDRRAYSTECGAYSWTTIEEAEKAMLSPGWDWKSAAHSSEWMVDKEFPNTDSDGWSYDVDFGNFRNASGTKAMMHFVRRRRLIRMQDFDTNRVSGISSNDKIPVSCDHCDLSEIEKIDNELLVKIAEMTLKVDSIKLPMAPVINPIKEKLITDIMSAESMGISALYKTITAFQVQGQSSWGKMFTHRDKTEFDLPNRIAEVKSGYFEERALLAQVIIRKHDVGFEYHCNSRSCGSACVFAPEACAHTGCDVVFSKKWFSRHDAECPHKVIPCPRTCGDNFPRRLLQKHMESICPLRPVQCPFADMGCSADLLHKDVPEHLDTCGQSHLLLAIERVREQQEVIKVFHSRLNDVEKQCSKNTGELFTLTASLAAAGVALEVSEKRSASRISEEISKCESRLNDKISRVGTQTNSIQSSVQTLETKLKPFFERHK